MSVLSLILGRPLASSEQKEQKIGVLAGLPVMGLDGLAPAAYGPEAALTILIPLGVVGLRSIGPIMLVILALLAMLYVSYRQTIAAYPVNGGSYTVAKENLGAWAGLLAAAALMLDYVLNVAVGISSGVAALISAAPNLHRYTLPLCLVILALVTLVNLRGTVESGLAWALPTYVFVASLFITLGLGVFRAVGSGGQPHPVAPPPPLPAATGAVGLWILLRSFASGCTAMTGVEAVSNGVSAFKEPTVKHAHRTLTAIVAILAVLLGGIAYLSRAYHIGAMNQDQQGYQSVISQLVGAVAGRTWFYYVTIGSVLAVLCLSANTSFVDFPRLCRLIAKDDFLPRQFAAVGRRLVYSVGILFLASAAALLLIAFRGITDKLIPLFAVGAFLAFTLSQAGMVMHWRKVLRGHGGPADRPDPTEPTPADGFDRKATKATDDSEPRHKSHVRMWVNGVGAAATGTALAIILAAKFVEGAWITILAIPALLALFWLVHRHYAHIQRQVECHRPLDLSHNEPPIVLVPIRGWDKLTGKTLRFALHLTRDVVAVHLSNLEGDAADEEAERVRQEWAQNVEAPARAAGVAEPKLVLAQSPYRRFTQPLLREVDRLKRQHPDRAIAVTIPQLVERHWWQAMLHTRRASKLRSALWNRGDSRVVVVEVPWFVED